MGTINNYINELMYKLVLLLNYNDNLKLLIGKKTIKSSRFNFN